MEALNKLGINPWLLGAQIINFLILLWILNRFLYKPILKLFRDRSSKIEEGIKTAETLKKQAAEAEEKHRQLIEEAKKEAHRIIEQATKLGDEEKKKIIALANEEARKIVEKTMQEITAEKQNIMNEIKKEVGEMVVALSAELIKKKLDEKSQRELIGEAIKEVEKELEKASARGYPA
ncbi:MAG: F0F1 ATP synthase subunit B [candidate division WOR-3 bacterium]|nr:F0F1 ATP synthase subunit B [candidate division WOR-3 bacterium]